MRSKIVVTVVTMCITLAIGQWAVADPGGTLTYLGRTTGITKPIDVQGQYAYMGEGLGLTVLDITNPDQPVAVGRTKGFAIIDKLVVSGDYVYAAADPFGELWVIDVSDPTAPILLTSDDSHWVTALSIDGAYLYAATFGDGLCVYDIGDPAHPQEVGDLPLTGFGHGVDAAGGVAYAAYGTEGLSIVDVTDPANPYELVHIDVPPGYAVEDVVAAGDYLYTEYYGLFRVIDVSDPANPVEMGTAASGADVITIDGDTAFVINDFGFVISIDVSDPTDPQLLSTHRPEESALDLAVSGQYLYYTDRAAGYWVLDVADPSAPQELGTYNAMDWLTAVVASGDLAFVTDHFDGLMIVDVGDPTFPQAVGFYNSPNQHGASHIALYGGYVYVDANFDGLRVLDASDPASPTEVGTFHTGGDMDFENGYAYVASGRHLYVLDVSDPANPTEVAAYDFGISVESLQVEGGNAYVAAGISGLFVLDVSDPHAMTEVGQFSDGYRNMLDVALIGDHALVAVRDYYLLVLDVSDPTQITQAGSYLTNPRGVAVEGGLAYVPGLAKVEVIDLSDPANPTLVDSVEFSGSYDFTDSYPIDGRVYVTGMNYGLLLYSTQPVIPGDEVIYLPIIVR